MSEPRLVPVQFNRHGLTSRFLDEVARRVLVFDGAMGTGLLARQHLLTDEDYLGNPQRGPHEILGTTRPEVLEDLHASYLEVGADVVETDTFQGSVRRLTEWGLGDRAYEINLNATRCARRAADRYSTPQRPRFVAGSIGPSGALPSSDDPALQAGFAELEESACVQTRAFVDGGADLVIIETQIDLLEAKATVFGALRAFEETGKRLPIQCQVMLDTSGRMLFGTDVAAALTGLEALPIDLIGLNCGVGPDYMREPIRYLCERSALPVTCIPNAGLPQNVDGQDMYSMGPEPMARDLLSFVADLGVNAIGGCCGTTPEHIRLLVDGVAGRAPLARSSPYVPAISSALRAFALRQDPAPLIVGERVNSLGSRLAKRALLKDDYDTLQRIAREQVEGGAHALDVCVATTERTDEVDQMRILVKRLAVSVEAPLVIDTTEVAVVKAALEAYPGRAILNSINLENRTERVDQWLPLMRAHGARAVAMCIDERGQATTASWKLEAAQKLHAIVCGEYGLPPDALIFDALVFPITTGQEEFRNAAVETIEGIRRIKESLPGVFTILGVSNLSFGIAPHARAVLNSIFLYHAVKAGLDLAIINPAHVKPYAEIPAAQREVAEALLFNRSPEALARYIAHFEGVAPDADAEDAAAAAERELPVDARIHYRILHRKKDGVEDLIDAAVARRRATVGQHEAAVDVLNGVLLPAMKEVGDKFGAGELILPYVLQSAEVMKRSVGHLEGYLEKVEGVTKGKVILATVYGDVHDIGKSLVNTILSNNGYTVFDLGKQVPVNVILDKAVEVGADAIGLSALLVSTSRQMPLAARELHHRGLRFPVIIGGAAINRRFGRRINWVDETQDTLYPGGVYYCKDAFEGLYTVDQLVDPARREGLLEQLRQEVVQQRDEERARARAVPRPAAPAAPAVRRSPAVQDAPVPAPPFWGHRTLALEWRNFDRLLAHVDRNTLFRHHWKYTIHDRAAWQRLVDEELEPRLQTLWADARVRRWLAPQAIYGYYPVQADGNELIVYDPQAYAADGRTLRERVRFGFPRQVADGTKRNEDQLCLADYFRPVEGGVVDVAPLQVVTAGAAASAYTERLRQAGEYNQELEVHGVAAQAAEAMAEYVHDLVRQELGLPPRQGQRYSWGYPACPDLEDQAKLFRLLPATEQIGVALTESLQFVPEQSTAAIVVHHPQAKYFSVLTGPEGGAEALAAG